MLNNVQDVESNAGVTETAEQRVTKGEAGLHRALPETGCPHHATQPLHPVWKTPNAPTVAPVTTAPPNAPSSHNEAASAETGSSRRLRG